MNPSAANKLDKILSDNKSGSSEILIKLIKLSKEYVEDTNTLLEVIYIANKELKSFSTIQSFVKNLKSVIKKNKKGIITEFLVEQIELIQKRYSDLFNNSLPYLVGCKKITTLSNSQTLLEILKRLNKQKKFSVTIGESRPQMEGRIMAKELIKLKINVEIIPDSLLADAIEKSDCVIIGADTILSTGDIINKIGSRNLAIICKYFKKPFYVLATSDKFSNKKQYIPKERNKNEIWNYSHKLLKRTNYYFEVVEKKLITKVISN